MAVWPILLLQLIACSEDAGLPVVARGRYVEIATAHDDPVCGGTAAHMDRIIEAAFAVIGEAPPDRRFVRFEWLELDEENPVSVGAFTSSTADGVLIRSYGYLVEEHELIHAVQFEAWPRSNSFLHEGHAVLLDPKRLWRDQFTWPQTARLDDLLSSGQIAREDYPLAWFLVSQIVLDHSFEGLENFWHAVPRGSSATEVRAAYEALFGRPIEALIESYVVDDPDDPLGPTVVERQLCDFALCPAPLSGPSDGEAWKASGPRGCEDDPDAVGPDRRNFVPEYGDVWRDYTLAAEPGDYSSVLSAGVATSFARCEFACGHGQLGTNAGMPGPSMLEGFIGTLAVPTRLEVRAALDDLPTDMPGSYELSETAP